MSKVNGKYIGFAHEKPGKDETNDWITPKWIIDAFNNYGIKRGICKDYFFDLDPCASMTQPWKCARNSYNKVDNGLISPWDGNVYMNPPYGRETYKWISLLSKYNNGIALISVRTETKVWQDLVFPTATGFLFIKKRLNFAKPDGITPKNSSGAPSVLISWGGTNALALIDLCKSKAIPGAFLYG